MRMALGISGVLLAAALATAAEITRTGDERAACAAEGGCLLVSRAWIEAQLRAAFGQGAKDCRMTPT